MEPNRLSEIPSILNLHYDNTYLASKWSDGFTKHFMRFMMHIQLNQLTRMRSEAQGGNLVCFRLEETDMPVRFKEMYPFNPVALRFDPEPPSATMPPKPAVPPMPPTNQPSGSDQGPPADNLAKLACLVNSSRYTPYERNKKKPLQGGERKKPKKSPGGEDSGIDSC